MTDTPTSAPTVSVKDGDGLVVEILSLHTGFDGVRLTDSELNEMVAAGVVVTKRTPIPFSMWTTTILMGLLGGCYVAVATLLLAWCVTVLVRYGALLIT